MKNLLLLSLLAIATVEAPAVLAAPTQTEPSTATSTMSAKQRRAARRTKSPQVYKGTVAEQTRIVTDAAGSEDDKDTGDDAGKKAKKSKHKDKE